MWITVSKALAYLASPLPFALLLILFALLFNPMIGLPVFFSMIALSRYFWGSPTLINCSYQYIPRQFDEQLMAYLIHWNDDCDSGALYLFSSSINNGITKALLFLFGQPTKLHLILFIPTILILIVYLIRKFPRKVPF